MFKSLYRWTLSLAQSPRAPWALAGVAFAESSFFPVPPDVLLVPMSLAKPKAAWRYAAICTVASVLGGMVGWLIGYVLWDTLGKWLIDLYGYGSKMEALRESYAKWGALVILVKGVTPIPYKLVTIVSGLLEYNFALFVLLSIVTRGARFFLIAGLLNRFGDQARALLDRYFGWFMLLVVFFIVLGFWIAARAL
jgi:membrane protein YqaA with SNARE-associated domain